MKWVQTIIIEHVECEWRSLFTNYYFSFSFFFGLIHKLLLTMKSKHHWEWWIWWEIKLALSLKKKKLVSHTHIIQLKHDTHSISIEYFLEVIVNILDSENLTNHNNIMWEWHCDIRSGVYVPLLIVVGLYNSFLVTLSLNVFKFH